MKDEDKECSCGMLWLFIYACGFALGMIVMLAKGY